MSELQYCFLTGKSETFVLFVRREFFHGNLLNYELAVQRPRQPDPCRTAPWEQGRPHGDGTGRGAPGHHRAPAHEQGATACENHPPREKEKMHLSARKKRTF